MEGGIFDEGWSGNTKIYVPAESVDAYKNATGWSAYADNIQAIPVAIAKIKPDNFFNSESSAWENKDGVKIYLADENDGLCFTGTDSIVSHFPNETAVKNANNNYEFTFTYNDDSVKIEFIMDGNTFNSVIVSGFKGDNATKNGTYAEPIKVNEVFEADGINYVVTSVGDKNTVKISGASSSVELGDVVIPDTISHKGVEFSVTVVGSGAFSHCANNILVSSVVIGNNVVEIESDAFKGSCGSEKLTSVVIPANVKKIGSECFGLAEKLQSITVSWTKAEDLPTLGSDIFCDIGTGPVLHVPFGTSEIYKAADQWKQLTIEETVTIADILPERFPASEEYAWKCTVGKNVWSAYKNGNNIEIGDSIPLDTILEKDGDNYSCDIFNDSIMPFTARYKFNMTAGVLTSITVSGSFAGEFDGEYTPSHYFVSVVAGGNGTVAPAYSENTVKDTAYTVNGNKLTIGEKEITATANEGYEFDCWKIGETAVSANGTITADTAFTATFKEKTITVAEVLAKAESDFPTATESGWVNGNGAKAYKDDGSCYFGSCYVTLVSELTQVESGKYQCEKFGITYTFVIESDKLVQIVIDGSKTAANNGTYVFDSTQSNNPPKEPDVEEDGGLSTGAIIGICAGGAVALAAIAFAVIFFIKKKR